MQPLWIQNGRMIDPATGRDEITDLYIEAGLLAKPPKTRPANARVIEARGLVVVPGLIDLHVHLREPGNEAAETVLTGCRAAARGGFTTIVAMPNTKPALDTPEEVGALARRAGAAGAARVLPAPCITRQRAGAEVADLEALAAAGAAAFTDDGSTVPDPAVMAAAMRRAARLNLTVMDHALDPVLAGHGLMREGDRSRRLGLPGIPAAAEYMIVERNIRLAAETGCAMHIQHLSAAQSVGFIRDAQRGGLRVSTEATPHHLALVDDDVRADDPGRFKMSPPLGSAVDRQALREALADGTIGAFATDHAPHTAEAKARGFAAAPFGVIGLETAVGITYSTMVRDHQMPLAAWVERWTVGPARILGRPAPALTPGAIADVTLLDLDHEWMVEPSAFASKSRNTPFDGWLLHGRAVCTIRGGEVVWEAGS
jgi:dihydroorotase